MNVYEDDNFIVKPSPIEGLGLFAKRTFKKGDRVLSWHPKELTEDELKNISSDQKRYLNKLENGTEVLMQIPERYANHSDDPNTRMVGESDVAIRDIQEGEEITSSYSSV